MPMQIPIGRELYLWTMDSSGKSAPELLISSHGSYGGNTGRISVPTWTTVAFYGPHKAILLDPGLREVLHGNIESLEEMPPGSSIFDYSLSKYQGEKHGSGRGENKETYKTIQFDLQGNEAALAMSLKNGRVPKFMFKKGAIPVLDVLSIRNRWWMSGISLGDVFRQLEKVQRKYSKIHCIFCRASSINDPSYNALTGMLQ
jgi:hypothetical protein